MLADGFWWCFGFGWLVDGFGWVDGVGGWFTVVFILVWGWYNITPGFLGWLCCVCLWFGALVSCMVGCLCGFGAGCAGFVYFLDLVVLVASGHSFLGFWVAGFGGFGGFGG